jgi:hypothetical protein
MANNNNRIVTPENFANVLETLLDQYGNKAFEISESAASKAARTARSMLKATKHVRTGNYARCWSVKYEHRRTTSFEAVVYNRTAPGLPHLLEHSHQVGRNGHYEGDGEIAAIEQVGRGIFLSEVQKKL